MIVVCFDNVLTIDHTPMYPGVRYVVSEDVAQTMIHEGKKGGVNLIRHSGFNNFERRFRPEAARAGQTVLLWRHNAYGDNLMVTGMCAYMKLALGLKVHVVCAPHVMPIWLGMDKGICPDALMPTPVYFDATQNLYDFTVMWQAMLEENREPDQGNGIDDLWRFAGFDDEVGEHYRRPMLRQFPKPRGYDIGISLHSGNSTRTLPVKWNVDLAHKLSKKFPERKIHVFGSDKKLAEEFDHLMKEKPLENVLNHTAKLKMIDTMKVMEMHCGTVISPDSALLHLAESFGIPNIGLWGLFHPNDRAKHYKYHTAISNFDVCEHAPCRWHGMNEFPLKKCGQLHAGKYCNALAGIDIDQVVEAVK